MNEERDPTKAVDYILKHAPAFAKAKAARVYIEEYRKSKKALLMADSKAKTAVEREQNAYSNPEYIELLDGLKTAIEAEELIKWRMRAAELEVEVWRTQSANNRLMDKSTQ